MTIIDFVKGFLSVDKRTKVFFDWFWMQEHVVDEEYSFEGRPSDFVEKYTEHYDCLDGYNVHDMDSIRFYNDGGDLKVIITLLAWY